MIFKREVYKTSYYQPHFVINYPSIKFPFTRIVEYKHLPIQPVSVPRDLTVIVKEYSTDSGEPYYPVISDRNKQLYEQYRKLASKEKDIYFVGKLASYKYYNMDEAIKASLNLFNYLQAL